MFGIGFPELIIIGVIALLVFGPNKLPELAKAIGKGLNEFKKATQEMKDNLNIDESLKEDLKEIKNNLDGSLREIKADIEDSMTGINKTLTEEPPAHQESSSQAAVASGPVETPSATEETRTADVSPDPASPAPVESQEVSETASAAGPSLSSEQPVSAESADAAGSPEIAQSPAATESGDSEQKGEGIG